MGLAAPSRIPEGILHLGLRMFSFRFQEELRLKGYCEATSILAPSFVSFLAVLPWASHSPSLGFNFFICQMRDWKQINVHYGDDIWGGMIFHCVGLGGVLYSL